MFDIAIASLKGLFLSLRNIDKMVASVMIDAKELANEMDIELVFSHKAYD